MSYQTRPADVLACREQLLPIWADNLPVRGELDARLRWFYCDGPHGPGQTLLLEAPHTQAPVGTAGVGARTLWYRNRKVRAALFADLAIDRAHRSGFPALSLARAVKAHVSQSFDLGYGLPNAKAVSVYRRAGYTQLGLRRRYVRVLRTATHVERYIASRLVSRAVAYVLDGALRLVDYVRPLPQRRHATLEWIDRFDARFDALWESARGIAPVLCERSSSFLNWRFFEQPGEAYRVAALRSTVTGRLRAYAVISDCEGTAKLADVFGTCRADFDALFTLLIPELATRGFTSVSFEFVAGHWLHELLTLHGFLPRKDSREVAIVFGESTRHDPELLDPCSWYLTDLDEDA